MLLKTIFTYNKLYTDMPGSLNPSSTTGAPSETRDFTHFSPKAGVVHTVSPTLNVFANYSQGLTPPEVSSLYGRLDVPNLQPSKDRVKSCLLPHAPRSVG